MTDAGCGVRAAGSSGWNDTRPVTQGATRPIAFPHPAPRPPQPARSALALPLHPATPAAHAARTDSETP